MLYVKVSWLLFFKLKTAYDMCISDWSSDVCSSDLRQAGGEDRSRTSGPRRDLDRGAQAHHPAPLRHPAGHRPDRLRQDHDVVLGRSEERRVGKACVSPCRYRWLT